MVIGGGITGVSLLHHLQRRGFQAVLVERTHIAAGASGRNAGFLLAGVAENYAEAVRIFGREKAREVWHLTNENHDAMVEAVAGQKVGHRRLGSTTLASGPKEAEQLAESAQLLNEDGFDAMWDGKGLINPNDGEINPAAVVGALARQAPPGAICEGVNVITVHSSPIGVHVLTERDEFSAEIVILATNAYTGQIVLAGPENAAEVLPPLVQPRRAQMLATVPIARPVCDLPTYSHFGYRYWRQLPAGEILIGGWRDTAPEIEVGYDDQPTSRIQAHLEAQVKQMEASAEITHRWAGTMGFTESGLPHVGPVEGVPNVYICAGYNGHGMGFAFMSAKQLVDSL
jgi:glycine/D-amino acid oxidase-like deaminating enzyme